MPTPLWIGLFFITGIVTLYLFGFADSGDRVWVQALFMGSVVAVVVTMLLLLRFLDDPYHEGVGGSSRWRWSGPCRSSISSSPSSAAT